MLVCGFWLWAFMLNIFIWHTEHYRRRELSWVTLISYHNNMLFLILANVVGFILQGLTVSNWSFQQTSHECQSLLTCSQLSHSVPISKCQLYVLQQSPPLSPCLSLHILYVCRVITNKDHFLLSKARLIKVGWNDVWIRPEKLNLDSHYHRCPVHTGPPLLWT